MGQNKSVASFSYILNQFALFKVVSIRIHLTACLKFDAITLIALHENDILKHSPPLF